MPPSLKLRFRSILLFALFSFVAIASAEASPLAGPTATNLSLNEAWTEDTPLDLENIVTADVDSPVLTATLSLTITSAGSLSTGTSGSVTSTYNAFTGIWNASGPIADLNVLLASVTFVPAPNFNSSFAITTSVSDGVTAVTGLKGMTGHAVNDAPSATNLSAGETYTEDVGLNLVDIVVSDVDSPNVTATLSVSNPSSVTLTTGTSGPVTSTYSAGLWTASGPIANVNALLAGVGMIPAANFNGSFSITTGVTDGVAGVGGSKAVTGTAVNDAPTASNLSAGEVYTEDTVRNLVDIVVSDIDSPNVTAMLTLSLPSAGSLSTGTSGAVTSTYNAGTGEWIASGALASVNTLLAGVAYTPAANFNGAFSIATSVSDGAAAAVTGSKAMTGTAVNDAPTATNLSAAETYTEDTALNLVDIVVSDVDSPTLTATLTLSNHAGASLSTATSGAVTSTYSAGVWTASGAVANVNALLAGVTFTPTSNFSGPYVITTSVSDGVASAVTGAKAMTGTAVNDAPTATNLSAAETYTEDTALNLVDIVVSDVDSPNVTATLTLSNPSAGSLSAATSGAVTSTFSAGTWTASGALANVNVLLAGVTYMPANNFSGSFVIATSVHDGAAPAVTGAKTIDASAVNDPPTATSLSAAEAYTEDTALDLVDIVASDIDSPTLTATLTLSNPSAGSLNTGTSGPVTSTYGAGVWAASGPIGNVNALLAGLTFTPAADFNAAFVITTSVSDGSATATGAKAVTGTAVNDAPQLGDGTLAAVEMNNANPPGQPVSAIFSGQFADVDAGANLAGIAVVGNPDVAVEGTWQYSANAGADWFAIGLVDDGAAALALSAATLMRFVPAAFFSGAPAPLVARGLDDTYGGGFSTTSGIESRVAVNTSVNGGATAIAALTAALGTTVTEVTAAEDAPLAIVLAAPFPSPSAGAVTLRFALPQAGHARLALIDVRGREVARLADADYPAGRFQVAWDGRSSGRRVASGVYFARLVTPHKTLVRRIVITH